MQGNDNNIIELLPPSVVEKIAAGEVVERPASVLKELVENSIDAGAARIDVAVEEAGFSMMRVSDNGCGMSSGDLGRSVLPHATSKIRSADDLYSIATMGFRGEALASISAVSRMNVVTCNDDSEGLGHEITVEGGIRGEIAPASRMRGTTITVRDLFYNVPARKKFMKTQRGEQIAIVKILEQLAIPFPAIHFTVTVDGKKVLDLPPVGSLIERIRSAAGHEFGKGLVECSGEGSGMSAQVFVSTPEKLQAKPRFQSLYVNLRRIDNDSVAFAVREAFSQYLGHGNRPAFFCFLDVDPQKVDVNIHPTKQQMKFDDERGVFGFIYHTVREGLKKSIESSNCGQQAAGGGQQGRGWEWDNTPNTGSSDVGSRSRAMPDLFDRIDIGRVNREPSGVDTGGNDGDAGINADADDTGINNQNIIDNIIDNVIQFTPERPLELIQCYQIHGIFILVPVKNGIWLIDQHAAHERVLYEQGLKDLETSRPVSQQLLFPIVIEMSLAEKAVLESGINYFSSLGFEISDFGGQSVSISALPVFVRDGQAEATVREMVRYLLDGRNPDAFKEPIKRFAAAFACGAAIKSGQKLSQEEMNALINALFSADNPYTCPHGRPTIVKISVDELTRRFLR